MMDIPKEVKSIVDALKDHGFEAYVVGGCVRDTLIGRTPEDWDVTTNAKPEEIQKLFKESFYENRFFTVTVLTESEHENAKEIEVTTYRSDLKYTDRRRPEEVHYAKTIEEDLARRDFTMNAIALSLNNEEIVIDPYGGQADLKKKLIRAVGDAHERFTEDALRMMRAVRFSTTLGFKIEADTKTAIKNNAALIAEISEERVRDELEKMLMAEHAAQGIELLRELGLLQYILPELEKGYGVTQNKHHIYTVWEHNLKALEYAAKKGYSLEVRIASLLHDVGKPQTKRGEGADSTFYGHQVVGASIAKKALERLKFPRHIVSVVTLLIREHMFVYDPETVTLKGVRRLLARVGAEHMEELFQVRESDRIGSGVPKAQPYRLRHLKAMVEKVSEDPISPKMLAVNGSELMELLKIEPGPKVGAVLAVLLEEVLDDPKLNTKKYLEKRAKELSKLSEQELQNTAKEAKQSAQEAQENIDENIKKKYFVK